MTGERKQACCKIDFRKAVQRKLLIIADSVIISNFLWANFYLGLKLYFAAGPFLWSPI